VRRRHGSIVGRRGERRQGHLDQDRGSQLFAASVIAVVPVVALFMLIEKHLVGGLTAGAVK